MKLCKKIWLIPLFALLLIPAVSAQVSKEPKAKMETVYMYGVGRNFADSTIYLTAVQRLDNVPLDRPQGYLLNRYAYSEQFYQYLYTQAGKRHETCSVTFATSRAKAEKKYLRLRRRLVKEYGQQNVVELPADAFHFTVVPFIDLTR